MEGVLSTGPTPSSFTISTLLLAQRLLKRALSQKKGLGSDEF